MARRERTLGLSEERSACRAGGEGAIHEIRYVTWVGLAVNLLLTAAKFASGILGHSQAVVADAVHSMSDMATDLAILIGVKYWTKPADASHPHGHRRIETVVTLGIGVALAVVATGLIRNAVVTLHEQHESAPRWIAFGAAVASVVAKEILYRWTVAVGRKVKSGALIANAWHHRSDALSSIPAAVAVAGAMIDPSWSFLDHIGAVVVSLFIYQAAFKIMLPAYEQLIDSSAPPETLDAIRAAAMSTNGVLAVHAIRTRYVGGSSLAVDLHVEVEEAMTVRVGHYISEQVEQRLLKDVDDVVDVVVHLEPHDASAREGEDGL